MNERIRTLLEEFAHDSEAGEQGLSALMREDREGFHLAALAALESGGETAGLICLATLLAESGLLLRELLDPARFSKPTAVSLARQIAPNAPQVVTELVALLPGRGGESTPSEAEMSARALDLLDAADPGAKLVPRISHLLRSPNPRLRSKAALMIGRRMQNPRAAAVLLEEPDPRVRANAVESLWGADSRSIRALLWQAAGDLNNRVVGNALRGLCDLQDRDAIPRVLKMAEAAQPGARATAAWVMGEIAHPRFLGALERLSVDLYASVRRNAAKAIALVQAAEEAGSEYGPLDVQVLYSEILADNSRSLWARAEAAGGEFLSGLASNHFIVWEGDELVADYDIVERHASGPVSIGFALAGDEAASSALLESAERGILACLERKRPTDLWAVVKTLSSGEAVEFRWRDRPARAEVEAVPYLGDCDSLRRALDGEPAKTQIHPAALEAVRLLLPSVPAMRHRHVVMFAESGFGGFPDLDKMSKAAVESRIAVHAIVVGPPHAGLEKFCHRTEGTITSVPDPAEVEKAVQRICAGLIDRYEIHYRADAKADASHPDVIRLRIFSPNGCGDCRAEIAA